MDLFPELIADAAVRSDTRLRLPEHRQVELYTRRKTLSFAPEAPRSPEFAAIGTAVSAFLLLQTTLEADDPAWEGRTTWGFYSSLPRTSTGERAVAELFRILRVVRKVAADRHGHVAVAGGLFRLSATLDGTVFALDITRAGLDLLVSAVAYYLGSINEPYSAAYVEAMLLRYFADIVDDIKRFSDEGRSLYQFRETLRLNRHLRLDCDTARVRATDTALHFDIGEAFRDSHRFPIDFFVVFRDVLHIIPVEALSGDEIAIADLPRWRARGIDGATLPARFRMRFAHEIMSTDVPMT